MWDKNKVRIVDIAEELGVSTATVSNVIHGKTAKISAKTVEMVQRKLQERGYIPNMAATLLAQNDSHIIGVVVNSHPKYEGKEFEDPFLAACVNYLSDAIADAGCFMMLKKENDIHSITRFASMWNMDGMILIGFCGDEYQTLRNTLRIPFVVYDGESKTGERFCNITIDDYDGGRQVGTHFRAMGRIKAFCIADNREEMDYNRYRGFCEGLGEKAVFHQIPMREEERHLWYESHLEELLACDAAFAVSDYYAIDLMLFLQKKGLRIPEQMVIAGFDGSARCELVIPPLTSVRQDDRRRAYLALELLKKMREDDSFAENRVLPVSLQVRGSSS